MRPDGRNTGRSLGAVILYRAPNKSAFMASADRSSRPKSPYEQSLEPRAVASRPLARALQTGGRGRRSYQARGDVGVGGPRTCPSHEALWRGDRGRFDRSQGSGRRLLLSARPVGLRQDVDAPNDRRPRDRDRRRHPDRRDQRHRIAASQARHGDDVPELRALPPSLLRRQCRLLPQDEGRRQDDPAQEGDGVPRARRHDPVR